MEEPAVNDRKDERSAVEESRLSTTPTMEERSFIHLRASDPRIEQGPSLEKVLDFETGLERDAELEKDEARKTKR